MGDVGHVSEFYKYQERRGLGGMTDKHNKQNAHCVAKMLKFMERQGGAHLDPTSAIHPNSVDDYFHRLSQDLDGSGKGYGLQPTATKNEIRACKLFFMKCRDDSVCEGDDKRANIFRTYIDRLDGMSRVNSRKVSWTMTKQNIEIGNKGLIFHPINRAKTFTNSEIEAELDQIVNEEKQNKSKERQASHSKYSFLLGYLTTRLQLDHFQRPGAVVGMTTEQLKEGLKRVVSLEFGERYHILVADHKLGNIQPASFFVDEYEKKLLELYRKRYRPNGPRNKLFLTFGSGKNITNFSKITEQFQARFGLLRITPMEMRAAIDQIKVLCPKGLATSATVNISAITSHSAVTAQKYYQSTIFHHEAQKAIESVHRIINATAHLAQDHDVLNAPGDVSRVEQATPDTTTQKNDGDDDGGDQLGFSWVSRIFTKLSSNWFQIDNGLKSQRKSKGNSPCSARC